MLTSPLCGLLGIELPILNAPMGPIAGPELAAAVSNAGGLGTLGLVGLPVSLIGEQIRRTRALTRKPFLANLIIAVLQGDELAACFDAGLSILGLFGGDPRPFVADAHRRDIKVIPQVASVSEAVAAAESGVDAMIAQGVEAGGTCTRYNLALGTAPRHSRCGAACSGDRRRRDRRWPRPRRCFGLRRAGRVDGHAISG